MCGRQVYTHLLLVFQRQKIAAGEVHSQGTVTSLVISNVHTNTNATVGLSGWDPDGVRHRRQLVPRLCIYTHSSPEIETLNTQLSHASVNITDREWSRALDARPGQGMTCRSFCQLILHALLYWSSSLVFFLAATPSGGRAPDATRDSCGKQLRELHQLRLRDSYKNCHADSIICLFDPFLSEPRKFESQ